MRIATVKAASSLCLTRLLAACLLTAWCGLTPAVAQKPAPIELRVVPSSHVDLSWLGTQKEIQSRFVQILTDATEQAKASPNYRFFIDNVYMLQKYLAIYPERTALLRQLVTGGQFEINAQWTIPHTDDNGDEGDVRNIFYAKKFVKENFGVDPTVVSYTDLPEWMVQTPQVLRGLGIQLVAKSRLGPENTPLLWWEGLDGSRVLTANGMYGGAVLIMHGLTVDAPTMRLAGFGDMLKQWAAVFKTNELMSSLGPDLWLPVKNLDRNIVQWNAESDSAKIRLSTFGEYFQKVKDLPNLPVVRGEVPDAWVAHREGGFAKTMQDEQTASNLLLTAEKLATAGHLLGLRYYPGAPIAEAWKSLALAADHGYVGVGGREADEVKVLARQKALLTAQDIINDSISFIAEKVRIPPRPCIPIVVFNPLSWARTELVAAHVTFYPDIESLTRNVDWAAYPGLAASAARGQALVQGIDTWPIGKNDKISLEDAEGRPVEFQQTFTSRSATQEGGTYFVFRAEDVPSLGYKTYYLYPTKEDRHSAGVIIAEERGLENQYLRVSIDPATGAITVQEKATGKVIVNGATVAAGTYAEQSAYTSGKPPTPVPLKLNRVEILERGPVRGRLRLVYTAPHPGIQGLYTDLSLSRQNKVDLETVIKYDDFSVKDALIVTQLFPLSSANPQFHYGVPYGYSTTTDLRAGLLQEYAAAAGSDTSFLPFERYKITRVVQQWLAVSNQNAGFTIASNRRMFELTDGLVQCVLLGLIPSEPERAEILHSGKVLSRFSITPISGSWQQAKAYRFGWELNSPLIPYTVQNAAGDKTFPPSLSFLSASPDHAVVTVMKKAEEDDGVIVRLFEAEGREGKGALAFFRPVTGAWITNLLEEEQRTASLQELTLKKNEIKTLKLHLQR